MEILIVLLCFVVTFVLLSMSCYLFQLWKFRNIRHIPGPAPLPLLGNLLQILKANGYITKSQNYKCILPWMGNGLLLATDLFDLMIQQLRKYSPISKFFVGPSYACLIISEPEMMNFFLLSSEYITKSQNYKYILPWMGNGILLATGDYWHKLRKLISPIFSAKPLRENLLVFNSAADILIDILQKHVDKNTFDIWNYMTNLTLDIACETTMGVKLNTQKSLNKDFIDAIRCVTKIVVNRTLSIWKCIDCLFWLSNDYRKQKNALQIIHGFTNDVIEKRRQHLLENNELTPEKIDVDLDSNKIVIDLLLKSTIYGRPVSQEEIKNMVTGIIFAAHDTTACALSLLIFDLAKRPQIQEKIVEELHDIFGNDKQRLVTYDDLCNMKYADAVIKESLRLHTPVPIIGRRLTKDVEYKGTIFPRGLELVFPLHGAHMCSENFLNPDNFDPDRFVNEKVIKSCTFVPFSAGPRNCAGQKYAIYEIKVVLAKLLRHFIFVAADPEHDLKFSADMVLNVLNGAMINLKKRKF